MQKKALYVIIFLLVSLAFWIYRTSNIEYENTILILQQNHQYTNTIIISPSNSTCRNPLHILIIVTSYVGHIELRSAHRQAMPSDYLASKNASRIFLLAKIPSVERYITQAAIEDESKAFGDILQGSFYENYRNLTYKHLMGLQWASSKCSNTAFILKVDDDTVFNFDKTVDYLLSIPTQDQFIMGYILNNTLPRRNSNNKWFVTREEYPRQKYPAYLSGWFYIVNPKTAEIICSEAPYHPYFWIDDILVTGILTEYLNIKLQQLPSGFWLEYYELVECCIRDMVEKNIQCQYVVGPNGGRHNLLVEFNNAYRNCKTSCSRSDQQNIKDTCIMKRDRTIFSDGMAEVNKIVL
ncbi:unnamed protein product [Pieris macdunnoughi]|uniref:Hexosyltransferase n=1 Tax=Pieris macdunnoughi TaxID=345717 RepID=A0A821TBE3_9NEOP|nr:unnamed protein product [Pieris macdunnoughi]